MNRKKLRTLKHRRRAWFIQINILVSLLLIALSSLALAYICIRLQSTPIEDVWEIIVESEYEIFRLNWIPLLLVMLFLYALFNNTVIACGLTGGAALLLSIINRNMVRMRQNPFKPLDIMLGNEFFGIAQSIDRNLIISAVTGIAAFLVFFALCLFFIRNKKLHPAIHMTAAAIIAAVCVWYNSSILSDKVLYESLHMVGNRYNETDNFESKGFIYSFLYTMNFSRIEAPPSFDKDKAVIAAHIETFAPADLSGSAKPNIVLILSEAFSDILLSPNLDFSNYVDPLMNYKRLLDESISGTLIVPNAGGGTADTEFDIFTGLNTRHLRGTAYTYNLVTKPVNALPSVLSGIGYNTLALHPGYGWFYNRQNVFRYMGFTNFLDIESYDLTGNKGVYISERQTMQRVIDEYEQHMQSSPETPLFEFCITIQNHGPYKEQYGAEKNFDINQYLSDAAEMSLANYIEGMIDCDRELGVLTDYLSNRPEPVVLVYYGDHMPSFAAEIYNALIPSTAPVDSFEALMHLYKAPFIIWQNQAARTQTPVQAPDHNREWVITSNFFGVNFLRMLGFEGLCPFMDYVNNLSDIYPVILENHALTRDGSFIYLAEKPSPEIDLYRSWQYYWIFH